MRTFTKEELDLILKKHLMWLKNEQDGKRADLSSADLSYADLSSANLSYANLSYANLRSADFRYADLSSANLRSADFRFADLSYADLSYADLSYTDLSSADLSSANLRYANLVSANLISANLSSADLLGFQFNRHQALFTFDGMIRIGCHYLEIKEWLKKFKVIGKKEGYTKEEIAAYGTFIKLCAKLQKTHKKEKLK